LYSLASFAATPACVRLIIPGLDQFSAKALACRIISLLKLLEISRFAFLYAGTAKDDVNN
jgi:hypothetical protein